MDDTLKINGETYENWPDFFKKSFARSDKFVRVDKGSNSHTHTEQYISTDQNNKTVVTITYDNFEEYLIVLFFENPQTPGYTRMQAGDYFYRDTFADPPDYNGIGLEFKELNVKAIDKQLREGIKGKEELFLRDDKLIKSKVYMEYDDIETTYAMTYYFEKRSLLQRLKNLFSTSDPNIGLTTKMVDLNAVFPGL